MVSFSAIGTWVYALSPQVQQQIKRSIAGKPKQKALQILFSLPGIAHASLGFTGFSDTTTLPKSIKNIHLMLIYGIYQYHRVA